MERLAEDRKGPSSMEHKKRQMIAALETNVKVCLPSHLTASCPSRSSEKSTTLPYMVSLQR